MPDIVISYKIKSEDVAEYKAPILRFRPVPLNDDGVPLYTDMEWIKHLGKIHFNWLYDNGLTLIKLDEKVTRTDLIT